jgi:hypothetical protein
MPTLICFALKEEVAPFRESTQEAKGELKGLKARF